MSGPPISTPRNPGSSVSWTSRHRSRISPRPGFRSPGDGWTTWPVVRSPRSFTHGDNTRSMCLRRQRNRAKRRCRMAGGVRRRSLVGRARDSRIPRPTLDARGHVLLGGVGRKRRGPRPVRPRPGAITLGSGSLLTALPLTQLELDSATINRRQPANAIVSHWRAT